MQETCNNQGAYKLHKRAKGIRIAKKAAAHILLIVCSAIFIFPFLYMFFMSFMSDLESVGNPSVVFLPQEQWYVSNYLHVFDADFIRYFFNTFIVIVVNLVLVPIAATFCAFGFTRCRFKGREICFSIVLATIMLPAMAIQIPLYVIYVNLGWINTLLPLTVPAAFGGGAMNIFLAKQYMRTIPASLDEAAVIDGANRFRIYWSIYMPLCSPIIIFIMIGVFNSSWNDFMGPLMYLRSPESYTLALGIYYKYAGRLTSESFPNVQMATGVIMIIPSAIVFFIFQKQLIDGVAIGGVKG